MEGYYDKYRNSIRLKGWDYTRPGNYFVTICTKHRLHHLGEIRNGIIGLSEPGIIAHAYWLEIPDHYSHVVLDDFVVMPNHIHGILKLKQNDDLKEKTDVDPLNSTDLQQSNQHKTLKQLSKISPQSGSLSEIIRTYKGAVTRWCNKNAFEEFAWQRRFYDHIIGHRRSLNKIREYIRNNYIDWSKEEGKNYHFHESAVKYIAKE